MGNSKFGSAKTAATSQKLRTLVLRPPFEGRFPVSHTVEKKHAFPDRTVATLLADVGSEPSCQHGGEIMWKREAGHTLPFAAHETCVPRRAGDESPPSQTGARTLKTRGRSSPARFFQDMRESDLDVGLQGSESRFKALTRCNTGLLFRRQRGGIDGGVALRRRSA